jgi:DNA-binding NarL/FixJ family response regulator
MIRLLIADDHAIVREGLKQMLSEEKDLVVLGEAANAMEVLDRVREKSFDVLLMDLSMPGRSGVDLIKQIKSENHKLAMLVLSMHKEKQYAVRALKAGAMGYLTKESAPEQLVSAIRQVAAGTVYLSPEVAQRLALELNINKETEPHTQLSDREFQVFSMIVSGVQIVDIAKEFSVSIKTISTHKTRILQKMNMSGSPELIHYAIKHQLVDIPEDL